jgi:hypothetical protein
LIWKDIVKSLEKIHAPISQLDTVKHVLWWYKDVFLFLSKHSEIAYMSYTNRSWKQYKTKQYVHISIGCLSSFLFEHLYVSKYFFVACTEQILASSFQWTDCLQPRHHNVHILQNWYLYINIKVLYKINIQIY